jgi:outer membrane lipoprotein SlyB
MKGLATLCAVLVVAFALAGCGDDSASDEGATTETVATMPVETETTPTATTPADTTPTATTPAAPKPTTIAIRVVGGVPQGGIARPRLKKGDRAVIVVRADVGEEIHMHGYDLEKQVTPGKPVRLPFTATIPGRFEVELHPPDTLLAVVTVSP